jgi:hypothetical protein
LEPGTLPPILKNSAKESGFQHDTDYSRDKWNQWKNLQRGLNAFDQTNKIENYSGRA